MKFKDLGEYIFFDEFPRMYDMLVVTNLFFVENSVIPKQIAQIYTTQALAFHLHQYSQITGQTQLTDDNFFIIEPNKVFELKHVKDGSLEMMALEVENASRNLMVFIRKDGKRTNLYSGHCTDMRSALLQDEFFEWTQHDIEVLYLNLKWAHLTDTAATDIINVVSKIDEILATRDTKKVHLIVPLIGYEDLIEKLVNAKPNQVAITGTLKQLYNNIQNLPYIQQDASKAKIVINNKEETMDAIIFTKKMFGAVTVKIVTDVPISDNRNYYELQWAPLPLPFDMKLLATFVSPAQISGIINRYMFDTDVPPYLKSMCRTVNEAKPNQQKENTQHKKENSPQHLTSEELRATCGTVDLQGSSPKNRQKTTLIYMDSSEEFP